MRTQLFNIGYEYLVFDIDLSVLNNFMDGIIRMATQNNSSAG